MFILKAVWCSCAIFTENKLENDRLQKAQTTLAITKTSFFKLVIVITKAALAFHLTIVDEIVACSPMARNIGVVFDNSLSMVSLVNAVCKSAFFHLHKISKIRKFLTPETTKTIIHPSVTSKIDYYKSLLFGLPKIYFLLLRQLNSLRGVLLRNH